MDDRLPDYDYRVVGSGSVGIGPDNACHKCKRDLPQMLRAPGRECEAGVQRMESQRCEYPSCRGVRAMDTKAKARGSAIARPTRGGRRLLHQESRGAQTDPSPRRRLGIKEVREANVGGAR